MTQSLSLSEFGLKFIKAYEGFRARPKQLPDGRQMAGYGHILDANHDGDISRSDAEKWLKDDLLAAEALVQDLILAPMTQNQYDALVSLAHNIGLDAFAESQVVRHMNEGRQLAAAAAMEAWNKALIGNRVMIVDALVRRRAAEKALFLRPALGIVSAASAAVQPKWNAPATSISHSINSDAPDFDMEEGVVAAASTRESATLSADISHVEDDEDYDERSSPIAVAAAEVSERLDRLVDDMDDDRPRASFDDDRDLDIPRPGEMPEGPVSANDTVEVTTADDIEDVTAQPEHYTEEDFAEIVEDYDIEDERAPAASDYVYMGDAGQDDPRRESIAPYIITLILGLAATGLGAFQAWRVESQNLGGMWAYLGPILAIMGIIVVLGALYYMMRMSFSRDDEAL